MIRHVVVWSMQADAEGELDLLLAELRALPEEIEEIRALSVGPLLNESSFDAALCVDVDDAGALERYRSHPAHRPSLQHLRQVAGEIVVGDYEF
jgi:hypothetical protein